MIGDRLDDKFIISIDPKPERVLLTKNLAGENIYIGVDDANAACINIFDVLVVATNSDAGAADPLSSQYQTNLTSISTLLSLNTETPEDKILLSCFNDVQQYVYETAHHFTDKTDFENVPKQNFPIMKEFYDEVCRRAAIEKDDTEKLAFHKLSILLKEHAIGISSKLFNRYTTID
jgi:hypothetical protein